MKRNKNRFRSSHLITSRYVTYEVRNISEYLNISKVHTHGSRMKQSNCDGLGRSNETLKRKSSASKANFFFAAMTQNESTLNNFCMKSTRHRCNHVKDYSVVRPFCAHRVRKHSMIHANNSESLVGANFVENTNYELTRTKARLIKANTRHNVFTIYEENSTDIHHVHYCTSSE